MMISKASTVKILQQVHRRDFLGALEGDGPISSSMADVLVPEGMGARKLQPKSDAARAGRTVARTLFLSVSEPPYLDTSPHNTSIHLCACPAITHDRHI